MGQGSDGAPRNAARHPSVPDSGGRPHILQPGSLQRRTRICRRGLRLQLKKCGRGHVRRRLSQISAGLLAVGLPLTADPALAQDAYSYGYDAQKNKDVFGPGVAYSQLDAALLVYQESGGRVQATEPTLNLAIHGADGRQLTAGLVADVISGATPNGAVPSDRSQNFITPLKAVGSLSTVTSASGGSTVIHLPPTPGQVAQAALGRQYTVAANTLPVDKGFRDHRGAATLGWAQPLGGITELGIGAGFSRESDYQAVTLNSHVTQNLNGNNTTITLALNGEFDSSFPFGGIPSPLAAMSGNWKSVARRDKNQAGFVLGWTEVMTRRWLMQLNYAFDSQNGYMNDPYRVISVVDPVNGEPSRTLYESRPERRTSQSVFWDNKIDWGGAVTDFSFRYYRDSWGVTSKTVEIHQRINLGSVVYLEPNARWYQQTKADFFHYYLVGNQALPVYASSDIRLGAFTGTTVGAKVGFQVGGSSEVYIQGAYYQQTGNGHPADAVGQLRQQNLFSGTKAAIVFLGYTWDFH
jgi:hypothetical protein